METDILDNDYIRWDFIDMSTLKRWLKNSGYSQEDFKLLEATYKFMSRLSFLDVDEGDEETKKEFFGEQLLDLLCVGNMDSRAFFKNNINWMDEDNLMIPSEDMNQFKESIHRYCEECINSNQVSDTLKARCNEIVKGINRFLIQSNCRKFYIRL